MAAQQKGGHWRQKEVGKGTGAQLKMVDFFDNKKWSYGPIPICLGSRASFWTEVFLPRDCKVVWFKQDVRTQEDWNSMKLLGLSVFSFFRDSRNCGLGRRKILRWRLWGSAELVTPRVQLVRPRLKADRLVEEKCSCRWNDAIGKFTPVFFLNVFFLNLCRHARTLAGNHSLRFVT